MLSEMDWGEMKGLIKVRRGHLVTARDGAAAAIAFCSARGRGHVRATPIFFNNTAPRRFYKSYSHRTPTCRKKHPDSRTELILFTHLRRPLS